MQPPLELTSMDNPRIKAVVRLREARQRRKSGLFIAEGEREIGRAMQCGLPLREGFYCPALFVHDPQTHFGPEAASARWFSVTEALMGKMSHLENPPGVLAVFEQPHVTLDDLAQQLDAAGEPPLLLVAVGTTKPGNLGAMLRSAEAVGVDAVLLADAMVDLFNPNAIRTSTGAVFTLPVVAETGQVIRNFLMERQIALVAADPAGAVRYDLADLRGPTAIVIGAEDTGLDAAWRETATVTVKLPTRSGVVDSLNAATTAAVLLYEALRQRTKVF